MIRNSVIGALAVLTLSISTGNAATPSASKAANARAEEVMAEQIYDALNADPTHFYRHVEVQVQHGVVTLSGYVWSTPAIYHAEKVAAGMPGVTHVVDQMELERNGIAPPNS